MDPASQVINPVLLLLTGDPEVASLILQDGDFLSQLCVLPVESEIDLDISHVFPVDLFEKLIGLFELSDLEIEVCDLRISLSFKRLELPLLLFQHLDLLFSVDLPDVVQLLLLMQRYFENIVLLSHKLEVGAPDSLLLLLLPLLF